MAKAEKYTADDTINEAGWGAAGGAIKGYLLSFAVGALAVAAMITTGTFVFGGAEAVGGMFTPGAGLGTLATLSTIAGIASAGTLGTAFAVGGGLLGASDANRRANKSNARYMAQVQGQNQDVNQQAAMVQAYNQGAQMGMQQGVEQGRAMGQQEVVQHLQQAHAQMAAEEPPTKKFTDMHQSKLAAGHAHKVAEDKAMAAAAGNSIA